VQGAVVGGAGSGKVVEGHLLGAVGPDRDRGDAGEHLEAVHGLDHRAGLKSLARIGVTGRAFSSERNRRRELAVRADRGVVIGIGSGAVGGVLDCIPEDGRFAKALGEIDAMPVATPLSQRAPWRWMRCARSSSDLSPFLL